MFIDNYPMSDTLLFLLCRVKLESDIFRDLAIAKEGLRLRAEQSDMLREERGGFAIDSQVPNVDSIAIVCRLTALK